ncbi:hypothetical protein [Nocardia sp. XZ_19_385]|uniref:hypothetical protein n=1 Tax=Nocardia sp. XZ_19_385 TaxID=2769488 RepID=UPI00188FF0FF|nr:hypothetical protein [Nocardia sp. XZ_19_385]
MPMKLTHRPVGEPGPATFTDLVTALAADGASLAAILRALAYVPSGTWINDNIRRLPRPLLAQLFTAADDEAFAAAVRARLDADLRAETAEAPTRG